MRIEAAGQNTTSGISAYSFGTAAVSLCYPCLFRAFANEIRALVCCRFKDTIVNAKYGGHTEAVRRLLGQLPISAQSYSGSPYLDLSLFSYDDKWVSVMERPKTCGDHPIRYEDGLEDCRWVELNACNSELYVHLALSQGSATSSMWARYSSPWYFGGPVKTGYCWHFGGRAV